MMKSLVIFSWMRTFVKEFGREPKMYHYTLKNYLSVFQTNQYQNICLFRIPNSRNTFWTIALNASVPWSMEILCWNTNTTVSGKKSLATKWKCTKQIFFHTKKEVKKTEKLKNSLFHHLNLDTKTVLWKIGCDEYIIQKFN